MGWLQSIISNLLQTDPSVPPSPKQTLGGELLFPTIRHLLLPSFPYSFPAGLLALLGITAQKYKMPCGDLLFLLVGGVGQGTDWLGASLNFGRDQLTHRLS